MSFKSHLKSSPPNVASAVAQFTAPISEAARSSTLEDTLWKSWRELLAVAASTPHESQSHLVEFVQELRKTKNPKTDGGESCEIWGVGFEWEKLPLFGAEVREEWNETPESTSPIEEQQSWINRNAFLARLTSVSTPRSSLDYSLYGVWALRPVIEDADLDSDIPSNILLGTAAVWLLYAGRELKKRSESGQVFDGKTAREGDALRGKEWRGLNAERWQFWVSSLEKVKGKVTNEETKEALGKALKTV